MHGAVRMLYGGRQGASIGGRGEEKKREGACEWARQEVKPGSGGSRPCGWLRLPGPAKPLVPEAARAAGAGLQQQCRAVCLCAAGWLAAQVRSGCNISCSPHAPPRTLSPTTHPPHGPALQRHGPRSGAEAGRLQEAQQVVKDMEAAGHPPDDSVYALLISTYPRLPPVRGGGWGRSVCGVRRCCPQGGPGLLAASAGAAGAQRRGEEESAAWLVLLGR